MTPEADLVIVRRAYARQIAMRAGTEDPRIIDALATLRREDFLPPGPWAFWCYGRCAPTPEADPIYLYQDDTVPILPEKELNNGQPSFVTKLIGLCDVGAGDSVVHIGTGTGYFTSILAMLAGPTGDVFGLEIEPELARQAEANLAPLATKTRVVAANGWTTKLEAADVVLVNAGTSRFAATWLDALKPGGRLVVPLTHARRADGSGKGTAGVIFKIVRDAEGFAARPEITVAIYPCVGAADPEADQRLTAAMKGGGIKDVTRLRRDDDPTDAECWLRGDGWRLTKG